MSEKGTKMKTNNIQREASQALLLGSWAEARSLCDSLLENPSRIEGTLPDMCDLPKQPTSNGYTQVLQDRINAVNSHFLAKK